MVKEGRSPCSLLFRGKQKTRSKPPRQSTPRERILHYAYLLQGALFGLLETEASTF
jgi:hypothetical protein